jgi:hypothetical protein
MQNKRAKLSCLLSFLLLLSSADNLTAQDTTRKAKVEWFGYIGGDFRYFPQSPLYDAQEYTYFSAVFKPQFLLKSANGKHQLNFAGFARIDQYDNKRTHADIRDLYWHFNSKK